MTTGPIDVIEAERCKSVLNRDTRYALRGAEFVHALRRVGVDNLRVGARFLGISWRQAQLIAAGTHPTSVAASKLLRLMYDRDLFVSEGKTGHKLLRLC